MSETKTTTKKSKLIDQWLDIHYGDTSFNGRVFIGRRTNGVDLETKGTRSVKNIRSYVKMINASSRKEEYYITANTVTGGKRRVEHLFGLQNIVIDVDCHDDRPTRAINDLILGFIWRCKRDLWSEGVIPTPNTIVHTGRGVQLWWAIIPCYGGKDYGISLYHHNKIKRTFLAHIERLIEEYEEELEGLDIDPGPSLNPVGYFRLPGSYNAKSKCFGSLAVLHNKRYDQRELTKLESPEIRVEESESLKSKAQTYVPLLDTDRQVLQGYESTGVRRVIQLIKLRNLRDNPIGEEKRDLFNFSVYNALRMTYDHTEAMERLRFFNEGFKQPMTKEELDSYMSAAKSRGGYKCSNAKIIEWLEITPEEQRIIGLFPARGFQRSKPNSSRDEARRALKEDRDNKILALIEKGVSQAETARILNIGKNTVGRVLKRHKETVEEPILVTPIVEESSRHQNGSIFSTDQRAVISPSILKEYVGGGVFVMQSKIDDRGSG